MGISPVLEDPIFNAEHPLLLGESGAIVEYLIHKHGNGRLALPPSHPNYADYLYWFHFANSTLQPGITRRIGQKPGDPRYRLTGERLQRMLGQLEDRLGSNSWPAGDEFTAADVMTVWSLTTMRKFVAIDLTGYEAILAWLKRITDRRAYRTAKVKSDPGLVIDELISAKGPHCLRRWRLPAGYRSKTVKQIWSRNKNRGYGCVQFRMHAASSLWAYHVSVSFSTYVCKYRYHSAQHNSR
jgi:glutathione S-transferase